MPKCCAFAGLSDTCTAGKAYGDCRPTTTLAALISSLQLDLSLLAIEQRAQEGYESACAIRTVFCRFRVSDWSHIRRKSSNRRPEELVHAQQQHTDRLRCACRCQTGPAGKKQRARRCLAMMGRRTIDDTGIEAHAPAVREKSVTEFGNRKKRGSAHIRDSRG